MATESAPRLQHSLPARYRHHRSRNVAPLIRRQQHEGRCQLLRLARARERGLLALAAFSAGIVEGMSGVQIGPGATAFTRMPRSASICARAAVKFEIAPLVAA